MPLQSHTIIQGGNELNSLKELYKNIIKGNNHFASDWNYYKIKEFYDMSFVDIIDKSKAFIESFLEIGGKLSDNMRKDINILSKNGRLEHTVSIYFLGLLIYSKNEGLQYAMRNCFDKKRREYNSDSKEFNYIWFLTCFFHDIGYVYEEELIDLNEIKNRDRIDNIVKFKLEISKNKTKGIPNEIVQSIEEYYKYILNLPNGNEHMEHGILGGKAFIIVRKEEYNGKKNDVNATNAENRQWAQEVLDEIQYPIAWTIAAHNVWYCYNKDPDRIKMYKNAGLDELIINEPNICQKNNPLLFLLAIVDTVDPTKYIGIEYKTSVFSGIKNIKIECDKRILAMSFKDLDKENMNYMRRIMDMEKWLNLEGTRICERERYFEIRF